MGNDHYLMNFGYLSKEFRAGDKNAHVGHVYARESEPAASGGNTSRPTLSSPFTRDELDTKHSYLKMDAADADLCDYRSRAGYFPDFSISGFKPMNTGAENATPI